MSGEIVVPHSTDGSSLEAVRSTLIASSQHTLTQRGLRARYDAQLEPKVLEELVTASMSTQWIPLALAAHHYRALDGMDLPVELMLELGNSVGGKLSGSILGSLFRLAKSGGVSPWTPLGRMQRIWGRVYRGGSIGVFKVGPKDARIEVLRNPLTNGVYWSTAAEGLFVGVTELFARKAYCQKQLTAQRDAAFYALSWA